MFTTSIALPRNRASGSAPPSMAVKRKSKAAGSPAAPVIKAAPGKAAPRRVNGKAAYVISDEMAPTKHMADGRTYTSKHKFRQATRDAGCVEVGNSTDHMFKPRAPVAFDRNTRRQQVRESIRRQLHGGRA